MRKLIYVFFFMLILVLGSCNTTVEEQEESIPTLEEETELESVPTVEDEPSIFEENQIEELTYHDKLTMFIEKPYITNESFINFITTYDEYIDNTELASNAIYVSPIGVGTGEEDNPCSIYDAVDMVEAGQTIYLRGGNYDLEGTVYINQSGNKDKYITIRNYPNEHVYISSSPENISKYSKNNEFAVFALGEGVSYIIIEGLEIANISQRNVLGIVAWNGGQNNIIIRNNIIHDLKTNSNNIYDEDAGANAILLLGETENSINNILIYGNECYNNETGWCETISISSNCESVYVIENYVHDNTNIGIDFYGNAGYCPIKALDQPRYCVAALNKVYSSVCPYAEAAGLYVDGARDILLTNNIIKSSQYGIEVGAEELSEGYPVKNIIVRNNVMYKNSDCGLRIGGYDAKECGYVTDTEIYNNTIINSSYSGSGVIVISKVNGIKFVNNLVYSEINIPLVVGDMSSTYSKNIIFDNNYFNVNSKSELSFGLYKKTQKGLEAFNSLVSGINITGEIKFDREYRVIEGVTINAGANDIEFGAYDCELKRRINGKSVDIGAYEY